MTSPRDGGETVHCRYEGEYSQRHLERYRLNQAMRGDYWGREQEGKKKEREQRDHLGTKRVHS